MKNIITILSIFLITINLCNAQSKEERAVAAAVETLNQGILNPEKYLLENIASDELEFVDDLLHGAFDFLTLNTSDQKIIISGKNAIVRHIFIAKATNAGTPVDIRVGNLLVWKKEHGKWKLLARQAFRLQ
jgi:hypothetical protein